MAKKKEQMRILKPEDTWNFPLGLVGAWFVSCGIYFPLSLWYPLFYTKPILTDPRAPVVTDILSTSGDLAV